jgi:hypothetical protein
VNSLYKPLSFEKSEIRLLTLIPAKFAESTVECILVALPLPRAPPYMALSYHWGNLNNTTSIRVNGIELQVTVSLEAALRRLRAERVTTVWADALCINQMDREERSLQVRRIGTIFKRAFEVAVWFGNESNVDADAVQLLCAGKPPGLDQDTCLSTLPVFKDLLCRPYWKRVWIIQELAVASCISIYCGCYKIPWEAIDITCYCCINRNTLNSSGCLADESVFRFASLREVRADVLARQPIHLLDALRRTRSSLATDPRDKIFALLGLTFDGNHLSVFA